MGEAELVTDSQQLIIHSIFHFYGDASNAKLAAGIALDIAAHWNEPRATINIRRQWYLVHFAIEGIYDRQLKPETVWQNTNPRFNFFRIEEFAQSYISFVDGLKSNTGYFKLDNLLNHSTTAAHEYGHTLGLDHPRHLDIRGEGQPGIMYPRGTICDPQFQYDPTAIPLQAGGTLNPNYRKVRQQDIDDLRLDRLHFDAGASRYGRRFHQCVPRKTSGNWLKKSLNHTAFDFLIILGLIYSLNLFLSK